MTKRLEGKVAIVTGAAHGMGASHAICLAKEGADVAIVDICKSIPDAGYSMGSEDEMQGVVEKVQALGKRGVGISCDVSNEDEVVAMVDRVKDDLGRIDILVNNAAIIDVNPLPLWEVPASQWDRLMEVNLRGVFLCCKYAIPHMIPQKSGKIINIGSVWGREGAMGAAAYSASKGGVHNMTHALAKDVAAYNINVNAVAPGMVRTPMQKAAVTALAEKMDVTPEEIYAQTSTMLSIFNRDVTPEDVSNAVVFLASEESRNINGMVIYVDGGHVAA